MAATSKSSSTPVALTILTAFTGLMLLIATYLAFIYAPTEVNMGDVQRIFYFHVGAAWAGALAFAVTVYAGVRYLVKPAQNWDILGHSSVEVGLALITITLTSGPVWAQFAWGKPWTWDPKLTASAVMWLSYAAYLMLRQGIEDPDRRARFGSIYGIVAFTSVIMTYFGVRLAEATIHPVVVGPSAGVPETSVGLAPKMVVAMVFSFITFSFVYATLLWHRIRLQNLTERVNELKMRLLNREAA
jgi:heme exporter protein C